jgi:hypothetical protein
VQLNLKYFLVLLVLSVAMFAYLLWNPLLLPLGSFSRFRRPRLLRRAKSSAPHLPNYKREARQLDDILEKISKRGVESLTAEEKELLERTSSKYRRRAQSKTPDSGLAF